MEDKASYEILIQRLGDLKVKRDELMANHTMFRIGGPADLFYEAKSQEELVTVIKTSREFSIPVFILGQGANILVSDKGIRGLVIHNRAGKIQIVGVKGQGKGKGEVSEVFVEAESGALINQLVRFTIDQGLSGLEFLLSVPGTIGGALKINAHFRPERKEFIGNSLYKAKLLTSKNNLIDADRDYFNFGYDQSSIQETGDIVITATFRLKKGNKEKLWQIAMEDVKYRDVSQPIGIPCSGCTFRNPPDDTNLPINAAGWLLEQVGLKGYREGNVQFSEKHANFIQNLGGAKAQDVLKLIALAKEKVKSKFGVELKEEIFYAGKF